ncbi:hypothetical protein GGS20DRAFT_498867 [Poronia punctata]|nr:hypothetical protein GGS20DRAFT_498867 [Poronia punctata]
MSTDDSSTRSPSYFDDERFHQTLTIPPTPTRSTPLKVTYADFGHRNTDKVLLFCGPLFGSRYVLTPKDTLAQTHSIRIISLDRPGFGSTTDASSPCTRIHLWLTMVSAVLSHLHIPYISILAHSGGAIYAMNILLHLGHLLHPSRPYIALCTPWIHPSKSSVSLLKVAAGLIPNALVGRFNHVVRFIQGTVFPAVNFSSGVIGSSIMQSPPGFIAPGVDPTTVITEEKLSAEMIRRVNREDMRGLGQDALLLLKRDEYPGCWGEWGDYDTLVPMLARREERTNRNNNNNKPLQVSVYFAEADHMIGTVTGPEWFEDCWSADKRGDCINYTSCVIPKSDHDSILAARYGVMERVFKDMSGE